MDSDVYVTDDPEPEPEEDEWGLDSAAEDDSEPWDDEPTDMTDVEADADTLKNAGWGTDEDYNHWEN